MRLCVCVVVCLLSQSCSNDRSFEDEITRELRATLDVTVEEANDHLPFSVVVPLSTPAGTNPIPRIFLSGSSVQIFYDEELRAGAPSYRLVLYESMNQSIMPDSYYPRRERIEGFDVQIATRLIGADEPDFYAAWNQGDVAIFMALCWVPSPGQNSMDRPATIYQEALGIIESMFGG
jgi:hypothetical protein